MVVLGEMPVILVLRHHKQVAGRPEVRAEVVDRLAAHVVLDRQLDGEALA